MDVSLVILRRRTHQFDRLDAKIACVDHEPRVPISVQDRKRRVPRSGTDLEDTRLPHFNDLAVALVLPRGRQRRQHGKLLPQPRAVLKEISRMVRVEAVPPPRRLGVKARRIEGGYRVRALRRVLGLSPTKVRR